MHFSANWRRFHTELWMFWPWKWKRFTFYNNPIFLHFVLTLLFVTWNISSSSSGFHLMLKNYDSRNISLCSSCFYLVSVTVASSNFFFIVFIWEKHFNKRFLQYIYFLVSDCHRVETFSVFISDLRFWNWIEEAFWMYRKTSLLGWSIEVWTTLE